MTVRVSGARTVDLAQVDVLPPQRWLLFYHESMRATAEGVRKHMDGRCSLSSLAWKTFSDGFPDLAIDSADAERLEDFHGTAIILSFHSPGVIFEQMCLLYELARLRIQNFRIILPWFCTGTMERVEVLGQVATAASLARMLSACPVGPSTARLVIYDIHALQEQFYFGDHVIVELKSAVHLFKQRLEIFRRNECPDEEIAIAFPDDGAHKRFKAKFEGFHFIICKKIRDGDTRKIVVKEGDAAGRHCVIIDDLVQSGGTLLECAKPLKEMGASKVSCFVTHGVFPSESWRKFIGNELIFRFWITDSVPTTVAAIEGQAPFEVLSLAPVIADYLSGQGVLD